MGAIERAEETKSLFITASLKDKELIEYVKRAPIPTHIKQDGKWIERPDVTKEVVDFKMNALPELEELLKKIEKNISEVDTITHQLEDFDNKLDIEIIESYRTTIEKKYNVAKGLNEIRDPDILPFEYMTINKDGKVIKKFVAGNRNPMRSQTN